MDIKTTVEYHTSGGNYKCPLCQLWFNEKEFANGTMYTHWKSTHGQDVPEISLEQMKQVAGNFLAKFKRKEFEND